MMKKLPCISKKKLNAADTEARLSSASLVACVIVTYPTLSNQLNDVDILWITSRNLCLLLCSIDLICVTVIFICINN